jgi:CRISPR-associated protein Csb1
MKAKLIVPQGKRFQPTGFPDLGPARYQFGDRENLLVESPQSMANRLESTIWDPTTNQLIETVRGISYVRVTRGGKYLTSTIQEAHRINSPYILEGKDTKFFESLKKELGALADGPIDRNLLGRTLFKYDVNSLLHGVFLAKKELAGGRLRVARAVSAFIEAERVAPAMSGGVKNDHVNPGGDTKRGFGNVPFSRQEFVADEIYAYFSIDLAQLQGYGLGDGAFDVLALLALLKTRLFLEGDLRLRTACEFVLDGEPAVSGVEGFSLPKLKELESAVSSAIKKVKSDFAGDDGVTEVEFASK